MDFATLFIIIFIVYIGSCISKLLFYVVNVKKSKSIDAQFISIPFSSFNLNSYISSEDLKTQINNKTMLTIEILGITSFLIYTVSIIKIITGNIVMVNESFVMILINLYFLISLLYFSIEDILRLKISKQNSRYFLLSILAISLAVGLYRFISYRVSGELELQNITLGFFDNLLAGVLLSLILFLFIKINKKNFGVEDIYLIFSLGLILGFPTSFVALFFISLIGTLISVIYCIRIKKFKNVRVPFIPFMLLGYVIALGFGQTFINLL